MPTTDQRRAHYDDFVTQVLHLCADNKIRVDLASGRGRPYEDCDRMQPHLIRHINRFGARRAHSTTACLIAMQRHLSRHGPYTPDSATTGPGDGQEERADPGAPLLPGEAPAIGAAHQRTPLGDHATGEGTAVQPWRTRPNLGTSLALAVVRHGFKESRMTERMRTFTKLPGPLLHPRLWTLTCHLHSHGAARLDFAVLLEDLARWDFDQRHVATRWRESYFLTLDALCAGKEH